MKSTSWWSIIKWYWDGKTLLRANFHEALRRIPLLTGSIIDVGGTREPLSSYMSVLAVSETAKCVVVNISPEAHPDLLADAASLPVPDAAYDVALCFNLLEHVLQPDGVMTELARVIRTGGLCYIETPFLINIHANPHDYFRFTDTALQAMAERVGFTVESITVLGGGPFLAALSLVQPFIFRWFFVPLFLVVSVLDRIIFFLRPAWSERWPLGYLVTCRKSA